MPPSLAAVVGLLAFLLTAGTARASFIETIVQNGPNVVVTGSGSIKAYPGSVESVHSFHSYVDSVVGDIMTGAPGTFDNYGGLTGPGTFGLGTFTAADNASGDLIGVEIGGVLHLAHDYVLGTVLSNMAIYDNQDFSTLGLTPGSYTWTWGAGDVTDSFTLQIDAAAVPEPTALTMFLTMLGLGWVTTAVGRQSRSHAASSLA